MQGKINQLQPKGELRGQVMGGANALLTNPNWNADIFELLNVVSPFRNRVVADGGQVLLTDTEIAQLIPQGDWSWFYVPAGRKAGVSYAQIPGAAGDLTMTRASVANAIARNGNLNEVAANVGRLDFLNGAFLGQPIEPLASTLYQNSGWAGGGVPPTNWSQPFATGTASAEASTLNAAVTAYLFNTSGTRMVFSQNINHVSGTIYTLSVYVEQVISGSLTIGNLIGYNFSVAGIATYLEDNVVVPDTHVVQSGRRYSIRLSAPSTASVQARVGNGIGAVATASVRLSMPQIEVGSVATSFILSPIGSTATRQADVFTRTGASGLIGSGALTLYAEINSRLTGGANAKRILTLTDGTANNVVALEKTSTDTIRALVINGGVEQMSVISGTSPTGNIKVAAGIGTNDGVLFVNGTQIGTDTSLTIPSGLNRIDYGQSSAGTLHLNDRGRAAGISQRRWTNAELENLTRL